MCCPHESNIQTTPAPAATAGLQVSDLPTPGTCGSHLADRIVGGKQTEVLAYPWMVLIEYTKGMNEMD